MKDLIRWEEGSRIFPEDQEPILEVFQHRNGEYRVRNKTLIGLRKQTGNNIRQLAAAMQINPAYVSRLENCGHVPSGAKERIAKFFGESPDNLFPSFRRVSLLLLDVNKRYAFKGR